MNNRTISQPQAHNSTFREMHSREQLGETVLFYMMVRACANALAELLLNTLTLNIQQALRVIGGFRLPSFTAPSMLGSAPGKQWRPVGAAYLTRTASWE